MYLCVWVLWAEDLASLVLDKPNKKHIATTVITSFVSFFFFVESLLDIINEFLAKYAP